MIKLGLTFDDMKKEIDGNSKYIFNEIISPSENPEFFYFSMEDPNDKVLDYKFLRKLYSRLPTTRGMLTFAELTGNSIGHGNGLDSDLPISIKIACGRKGYAIQIEDCGKGFDINEKINLMNQDQEYFVHGGCGMKRFISEEKIVVSYEGRGNIANILYRFAKDEVFEEKVNGKKVSIKK